jgi:hypothetical protein
MRERDRSQTVHLVLGLPESSRSSTTADELSAWENCDVPNIDRVSDDAERADEKQDPTASLNFPSLDDSERAGTTCSMSSIACELRRA